MKAHAIKMKRKNCVPAEGWRACIIDPPKGTHKEKIIRLGHPSKFRLYTNKRDAVEHAQWQIRVWENQRKHSPFSRHDA